MSNQQQPRRSEERWIVHYRRYSSDEWLEEVFRAEYAARQWLKKYLYDRGPEAQAGVRHYVEVQSEGEGNQ